MDSTSYGGYSFSFAVVEHGLTAVISASQDNIRLWNVGEEGDGGGVKSRGTASFKIIAGHHGGVISQICTLRCSVSILITDLNLWILEWWIRRANT